MIRSDYPQSTNDRYLAVHVYACGIISTRRQLAPRPVVAVSTSTRAGSFDSVMIRLVTHDDGTLLSLIVRTHASAQ